MTEVMVEEATVVVNPDPVHERSPTPELDPTVESGKSFAISRNFYF